MLKASSNAVPTQFYAFSLVAPTSCPMSNFIYSLSCSKNDFRVSPMNKPHINKIHSKQSPGKDGKQLCGGFFNLVTCSSEKTT